MENSNYGADQWIQHYEQHQIQEMNPSFNAIDGGGSVAQEAARRRSRGSKRVIPTTILNANPRNFRALVQKFTGRSSGSESNRRKGPMTLDFGSPTTVSKEAIFPVSSDPNCAEQDHVLNRHVSNEKRHVTWSGKEATTTYQLGEETQDHDDYLTMDHMDYYQDFNRESATLEEFMMRDLDL